MSAQIANPPVGMPSAARLQDLLDGVALDAAKPLASQIYELLRSFIISMKLTPGCALSEKEIGALLNASKTPVREAIIRLEGTGLVNIVPQSGTYVAPLNVEGYISACFTRLHLEIGAVRAAAKSKGRHAFVSVFEDLLAQQQSAWDKDDFEAFFHLDEALHKEFFRAAEVPDVWETMRRTQTDVYRVRHLRRIRNIRNGAKVIADHKAIIGAILDGDADGAQAALIGHIGSLEEKIKSLADQPELMRTIEILNTTRPRSRRKKTNLSGSEQVTEETCQASY
ncbi:GntR family transcriptional regulator [Loktanella sp. D2R18]|uniref:GntR family transcriptional regulator n=1 Tax=Rhodobacterales TaxID=204455 RepID=UPI000DE97B28|nr:MULTISPECIES: GntR family transcriptional regulator [Rhodobacterales]MDO6591188.1 GntR family transcriptional regulator [Yoonia sp. 1_MG-2023]RBW41451.1 GntR family transcriptional regulator [Loktanella sp. D2R18]